MASSISMVKLSRTSIPESSSTQESQLSKVVLGIQLLQTKQDYALHVESQKIFDQTIRNRKCGAETTSCLCCPCTCIGTLIPFVLCYPCICYRILNNKGDCLDQCMQKIGCVSHIHPPKNKCELCCIFFTPIFMDLPNLHSTYTVAMEDQEFSEEFSQNLHPGIEQEQDEPSAGKLRKIDGRTFYTLPQERVSERARFRSTYELMVKMRRLTQQIKSPVRQEMV